MKTFIAYLAGGAAFLGLVFFGLPMLGLTSGQFFAPKFEELRRNVMIESRAYSEATVGELYDLKRQYDSATSEAAKATIAAAARHQFQIFPQERLPADLTAWMVQIQ